MSYRMMKNTVAATAMGLAFLVGAASPAAAGLCASFSAPVCSTTVPTTPANVEPITNTAAVVPAVQITQTAAVDTETTQDTASTPNVNSSLFTLFLTMLGGVGVMFLMYRAGKKEAEASFNEYLLDVMSSSRQEHRNHHAHS